ncbi:MAG: type I polyketide synthase [Mycobacterium sp.]
MTSSDYPPNAIAIVGMAGRFPGASSVSEFWRNLRGGVESIVDLSEDDLIAEGVGEKALANRSYVRRAALMSGIEDFDAGFFGFTPQAARMLDPQHRLFLQSAWHALEDAGYDPAGIDATVGVFGTSSASGYLLHNLMSHYDHSMVFGQGASFDMVSLSLNSDKDHLATRVAHQLNLRGPAMAVQTACSSSLVAVHLACQSILNGECEMALAGGSSIRIPHRVGYWYEPGSMVSPTGHCRPFDIRSDGTIFGSGVGVVVLKPLQDAIDDGDRIHAVIRGSALNNDGATKMNYAAPTAAGQAEVIAEAHAVAEVDAATVSYIESHGTGTPLGDPIEIEGLRQAFAISAEDRPGPCYVGSVKSNIGHLETAAGMAGLIKTILCLKHRAIPATLHYTSPNPELHLDRGPFAIRGEDGPWEWDGPLRAGVSSFGVGGTNAHVVLEEAPAVDTADAAPGPQVLLLSARTAEALSGARTALAAELSDADELSLSDVAYTLTRRRREPIRLAAVVDDQEDAANVLAAVETDDVFIGQAPDVKSTDRVVFVFPGQGAQYIGMARGLHECEPVFREHFDACAAAFGAEMDFDLHAEVFEGAGRNLERTDRAQPALFTVEYALAKLAESYGVRPSALAGHSIGEWVAGTLAGVFDLPTAVKAVSMRARLMHASPRGVMVAVALGPDAVAAHLGGEVDLAAVNDPGSCVVAGSEEAIRDFQARLAESGIVARRVRTAHAFHSRLMNPVIPEFTAFLSRLELHAPRIPLLSNVTGNWMTDSEATDPSTWARQIRETVRFSDELGVLLADPDRVVVEVGPSGSLTASAMRHPGWGSGHRAVRLMRHQAQNRGDHDTFLLALGQLWASGIDVDWTPRLGGRRALVSVPGYPFERQRHWVEYNPASRGTGGGASGPPEAGGAAAGPALTGTSQMEATLARIWSQCLGIASIDRNTNFFEVGGDSLVAISVAMTAGKEGLDLTPQDLYENQTVAGLAKAINARYAEGSLARRSPADPANPPVAPNVSYFLEHGLRDLGSWRVPLVLQLRSDVGVDDVRAVLTAVTNHHDALRLRLVDHGTWDQHLAEPGEFGELVTAELPAGLAPGSAQEREALMAVLAEQTGDHHLLGAPLTATHVTSGEHAYLVLSLHGIAGDNVSRDILLTDVFTAFAQQLAGEPITLEAVTTSWGDWLHRCAGLAMHPAVQDSRDYWLETSRKATLNVAGPAAEPPGAGDLVRLPSTLGIGETGEIDDARRQLGVPLDDMLLAALARAVGSTVGDGLLAIELGGQGRSVLRPDVDVRRTVGWFTTIYPVVIPCASQPGVNARELIEDVAATLKAVPHHGIGCGLLRYVYAPTARLLGEGRPADIFFSHLGTIPDLPAGNDDDMPVRFDSDTALPVRETVPGLGHAIELRVYRHAGELHVDWWFDTRRLGHADAESLSRHFNAALLELTREALAEAALDLAGESADDELALVDLSSIDSA